MKIFSVIKKYDEDINYQKLINGKIKRIVEEGSEWIAINEEPSDQDVEKWIIYNYAFMLLVLDKSQITKPTRQNELLPFIQNIKEHLCNLKYKHTFLLKRELMKFIVLFYTETFHWNIADIITSEETETSNFDFFDLMFTYSDMLPDLTITPEDIIKICLYFDNRAKGDLAIGQLYNAITNYCKTSSVKGWNLINYMISNNEPRFLMAAISGLPTDICIETSDYLISLIKNNLCIQESIMSLGFVQYDSSEKLNNVILYIKNELSANPNLSKAVIIAYCAILRQSTLLTQEQIDTIVEFLELHVINGPAELQYVVLEKIGYMQTNDNSNLYNVKKRILYSSIGIDESLKSIIQILSHMLNELKTPIEALDFISKWSINHKYKIVDDFRWVIQDIFVKDKSQFIAQLVQMLISNNPTIRFYANDIVCNIGLDYQSKEWIDAILALDRLQAMKLLDSIFTDTLDIEKRISLIMPLRNHSIEDVRTSLLQWLVWLIHDFGQLVKTTISNTIDIDNEYDKELLTIFNTYYDKISSVWDTKRRIKEIQPAHTQSSIMSSFYKIFCKQQSKTIIENVEEKSILLQFIPKINIGRGQSFKMRPECDAVPMTEVKTFIPIPMTSFSSPERYKYDKILRRTQVWK